LSKLKKYLPWIILVLVLFYAIRNPHGAATTGHHLGASVASGAGALATFVTSLLGSR